MAKISQSVPSQANNQLDTHPTAGPTGLHSDWLLLFNQKQFSEKCIKLYEISFLLMTPAIDTVLTQQNLWPVCLAAEEEKQSHGLQRRAIKTCVSLFSEE